MRITRKMKRELKQAVNPLEELLIIIKQYFPKLSNWIDNLTETRNQSYITYDLKVCLLIQILAFCSSYQSMNKIGRDFNSDIVINTDLMVCSMLLLMEQEKLNLLIFLI